MVRSSLYQWVLVMMADLLIFVVLQRGAVEHGVNAVSLEQLYPQRLFLGVTFVRHERIDRARLASRGLRQNPRGEKQLVFLHADADKYNRVGTKQQLLPVA